MTKVYPKLIVSLWYWNQKNYSGEMSGIDNCGNGSAERLDYLFAELFYFLPDLTFNGVSLLLFSAE